jgi:hypothetical protein
MARPLSKDLSVSNRLHQAQNKLAELNQQTHVRNTPPPTIDITEITTEDMSDSSQSTKTTKPVPLKNYLPGLVISYVWLSELQLTQTTYA